MDQNGKKAGDGTPYRYISATNLDNNVCTGDMQTTHGKIEYINTSIANQYSCSPNTLNAGNYYNFPAATAGSDNHAIRTTSQNSICPKGWRLPPNSDNKSYQNLIRNVYRITDGPSGSVDAGIFPTPLSFVRLGRYNYDYGSLGNRGSHGRYWSSTASSSVGSHDLLFHSGGLNPQYSDNRTYGFSVRCVSR